MGLTLRALKKPEEALNSYERAIEHWPHYSDCYFNMGNIYFEGDLSEVPDYAQAERHHQMALESLERNARVAR